MEARVHFLLSVPGSPLTWICADPVHATTVSLGLCVCQSWLQDIVSWMPPSLLVLLLFLPPLPHSFSRPEGRGFPLKTEHSFLYAQLLVSLLVPIYCKKKLLRWWLSEALTHGYRRVSLGVILLLCNQNRAHEQSCGNSEYLREHFKKTKQKSCYSVSSKHEKLLKCVFVLPRPPGVSERRGLFQMAHYYLLSVIRVRLPFVCVCGKLRVCHAWLVFGI